jgi:hypothetical protein
MNRKKIKKILKTIAERDGVSIDYVRSEIQKAIDIGMANPNPYIQEYWMAIPHKGEHSTPEEVICFTVDEINNKKL